MSDKQTRSEDESPPRSARPTCNRPIAMVAIVGPMDATIDPCDSRSPPGTRDAAGWNDDHE